MASPKSTCPIHECPNAEVSDMNEAAWGRVEEMLGALTRESAVHGEQLKSISADVKRINGTVAALTKDSIEAKIFQAEHSRTVEKIDEIQADLNNKSRERDKQFNERNAQVDKQISDIKDNFRTEQEVSTATQRTNEKYRSALRPWIDRLTIAVVVLILWNGRSLLEAAAKVLKFEP